MDIFDTTMLLSIVLGFSIGLIPILAHIAFAKKTKIIHRTRKINRNI